MSGGTLVIEEQERQISDVATYFSIPMISLIEFYREKIKDAKYHEFLIGATKKIRDKSGSVKMHY
jgi:hypothetical protein